MTAKQRSTVVGVFADRRHADQAVADLKKAGFRDDQIGVAMRHDESLTGAGSTTAEATDSHAGSGAMAGILTGLGLGTLAGLGVLAGVIPVVGPAIAAGTLGVILSNAAVGAGVVGLAGALIGAGVPEEEAKYYHSEFEAGRTIVTVNADGRYDEAWTILKRHNAYDMSTRGTATAGTTTTGTATTRPETMTASRGAVGTAAGREGDTIQVKEERLLAEKRPVNAGEVRVHKEVHTETRNIEVPVQREEVVIERTPAHGKAATGEIREGEEIRIPVREEQVNLVKEAVVTEEVKVGKRVVQDTEHVSGQVRKEEVHVDREGDVEVRDRGTGKRPV
jgi:uncharacterized protein (TIGR02271 family)